MKKNVKYDFVTLIINHAIAKEIIINEKQFRFYVYSFSLVLPSFCEGAG